MIAEHTKANDEADPLIELDGSFGEGGGQILRTALSLACLTGKAFRIIRIRRNRSRPGLQPQHLTAVRAAKALCRGDVEGDKVGSEHIEFLPSQALPGDYDFDIGTAGSTSLLLHALLPPLVFADGPSRVRLIGGTQVPMSPPFDYLQLVFAPFLRSIGITVDMSIETYGFYPHGGGRIDAAVECVERGEVLGCMKLLHSGGAKSVQGVSCVGNLPVSIAERQRRAALEVLGADGTEADIEVKSVPTTGRGTYVFLRTIEACASGFSSIGERGKRAEVVGSEAAHALVSHSRTGACLDPHLSDQVMIYLSLAEGQSTFSTSMVTEHLITNLAVIQRFLPATAEIKGQKGHPGAIIINGIGYRR